MSHLPRVPIHLQNSDVSKAFAKKNPSYESFRPNIIREAEYRKMTGRANDGMSAAYRVRRYPNGELDYVWVKDQIVNAIHKMSFNGDVLPIEQALLNVVLPDKYPIMEPQMAEIRTQLSSTEKKTLRALVMQHLLEEANYNAGHGGGNVTPNFNGIP